VAREDLAGLEIDHADVVLVDDSEDTPTGVGSPDPCGAGGRATQGDGAGPVDGVGAEPEVTRGAVPGRVGLGHRPVGLTGRDAPDSPVWSLFVVDEAERIELGLLLSNRHG
jgi:hypothetical protein